MAEEASVADRLDKRSRAALLDAIDAQESEMLHTLSQIRGFGCGEHGALNAEAAILRAANMLRNLVRPQG